MRKAADPGRAESLEALARLLGADAEQRGDVASLGGSIAESEPVAGFEVVGLAADAAVAAGDHGAAAAALQEFVTRVPGHIPALARLVEICEAGELDATLQSSRAQLTDAYIAAGQGDEARILAEGLVAREPWERANIERFRRALVLIGEDDPDEIIAQRLSGQNAVRDERRAAAAAVALPLRRAPIGRPTSNCRSQRDRSHRFSSRNRWSSRLRPFRPAGVGLAKWISALRSKRSGAPRRRRPRQRHLRRPRARPTPHS